MARYPAAIAALGPAAATIVPFDSVRIRIMRVTGRMAVDATVAASPGAASMEIALDVPLSLSLPVTGEAMTLTVECINSGGETVYRAGPTLMFVHPGVNNQPVNVMLEYVGPGAHATTLRIVPHTLSVLVGAAFSFTATAFDATGNAMTGVPIVWSLLGSGLSIAKLTSPLAGVGNALSLPGVTGIVAAIPGGPADTAQLTVLPPVDATRLLQLVSGGAQSGLIGALLAAPVVVKVVNGAGAAVSGVPITFTPSLGGLVGTPTATTDANGRAQTTWTLGSLVGTQTLSVTAAGLTGQALSVPATGLPLPDLTRVLQLVSGGSQSGIIGALLASPIVVKVVNAAGAGVGGVPISFVPSAGGLVGSPNPTTDANGLAQSTWTLGSLIGQQLLSVTGTGLTGSPLSVPATGLPIPQAVATALSITSTISDAVAGVALSDVTVRALDASGNLVTGFTNPVSIALGQNPGGATLTGTRTVTPSGGIATFRGLSLDKAATGYTMVASATGLTSATTNSFGITHAAASAIALVSGDNQSGLIGLLLGSPLAVRVTDAFGNAVPGVAVNWSILSGNGLLGNATTQTNSSGTATNNWTLSIVPGLQSAAAAVSGLSGSPVVFHATGLIG
jgi:hypothetical protein